MFPLQKDRVFVSGEIMIAKDAVCEVACDQMSDGCHRLFKMTHAFRNQVGIMESKKKKKNSEKYLKKNSSEFNKMGLNGYYNDRNNKIITYH